MNSSFRFMLATAFRDTHYVVLFLKFFCVFSTGGVEVTLLQQLGWINLCEPAFYIYIYIFYHNRFFSNLLYILLIVGLTCHRFRPFTVASCSRDSTVRIWSLSHLACSLQIDVLAKKPLEEIVTPNTGMVSTQISEILCV